MFCPTIVEDEVHFLFQCPQYNLLRNEYDIPFINIYYFNKINDFINPALIHDAKLVCKFIKEAMFLENIHQSQYIGVIQLTLKAAISHDKRHLAIT
jgi:CTP:phosphocholine cytidylyltransferase-like protein